ncbi:hypothetical protein L208DRAFT_1559430 [Tricholoma matsutake]|nr:hypothetical protein L208DRAFT_1559430 [Tricholoma matsutake 945]
MKYWHQAIDQRPQLAKMGLDFCSAPASSVDAEHAFSVGRLEINHLQGSSCSWILGQNSTLSRTFRNH